jgi:hypothetical protein
MNAIIEGDTTSPEAVESRRAGAAKERDDSRCDGRLSDMSPWRPLQAVPRRKSHIGAQQAWAAVERAGPMTKSQRAESE